MGSIFDSDLHHPCIGCCSENCEAVIASRDWIVVLSEIVSPPVVAAGYESEIQINIGICRLSGSKIRSGLCEAKYSINLSVIRE